MDTKAIETHIRGILEAIGEDPDREGLRETPQRVARMYEEIFAGISYSNHEIAEMFGKTFESPSPGQSQTAVVMKDISVFSYCEHHMALMYDMNVNVAYVPRGIITMCSVVNDFAAVGQCHACRRSEEQSVAERHIGGNRTAVGFL